MLAMLFLALAFFIGLGAAAVFMYGPVPSLNIIETLAIYGAGVVLTLLAALSATGAYTVVAEMFEKQ